MDEHLKSLAGSNDVTISAKKTTLNTKSEVTEVWMAVGQKKNGLPSTKGNQTN